MLLTLTGDELKQTADDVVHTDVDADLRDAVDINIDLRDAVDINVDLCDAVDIDVHVDFHNDNVDIDVDVDVNPLDPRVR